MIHWILFTLYIFIGLAFGSGLLIITKNDNVIIFTLAIFGWPALLLYLVAALFVYVGVHIGLILLKVFNKE
nr:MAG TPA: hypothetical protein [Caudoviricetes sp.]DAQ31749.1 MAG TPA: hypothetical protein [Caudoviricetes sp.]